MKVFLAGASGAIGRPLVDRLVAAGHEVVGTTRSQANLGSIREQGAQAVALDAFDADAVRAAVRAAAPDVVVHQLTDLPANPSPKAMRASLPITARLRRETVPVFVDAAREAGARRVVVQSMSFVTAPSESDVQDESAPLWLDCPFADFRATIEAVRDMEVSVAAADGIEGIVLRYGFYYGPGTWYERRGAFGKAIAARRLPVIGGGDGLNSFVHVDDAAAATTAALAGGAAGVYNVTDADPVRWRDWIAEAARLCQAKPPRRIPALVGRLAAGPTVVHYANTLRAQSSERFRSTFAWEPRPRHEGFAEAFGPSA